MAFGLMVILSRRLRQLTPLTRKTFLPARRFPVARSPSAFYTGIQLWEMRMRNELEDNFGRALQSMVAHLIKNAEQVPEPVLKNALEFEAFTWEELDKADKLKRLSTLGELTDPSSEIGRHMEAYPHSFSKKRYQDYLDLIKLYKKSLAV